MSTEKTEVWKPKRRSYTQFTPEQMQEMLTIFNELYREHYPDEPDVESLEVYGNKFTAVFSDKVTSEEDLEYFLYLLRSYERYMFLSLSKEDVEKSPLLSFTPIDTNDVSSNKISFSIVSDISFEDIKSNTSYEKALDFTKEQRSLDTLSKSLDSTPKWHFYCQKKGKFGDVPGFQLKGLALLNNIHGLSNAFICDSTKTFSDTLRLLNQSGIPDNLELLLVRKFPGGHVHPIKIERVDGVNHFIIIDSFGKSKPYMKESLDLIRELSNNSPVYYIKEARQTGDFDCYTFATKDLKKMAATPNLHLELKINHGGTELREDLNIFECSTPARFFSYVQSRSYLLGYIDANPDMAGNKIFTNKTGNGETLREKIYRERSCGNVTTPLKQDNGSDIPRVIDYFAAKYAKDIDAMLEAKSPEKIDAILEVSDARNLTVAKLQELSRSKNTATSPKRKFGEGYVSPNASPTKRVGRVAMARKNLRLSSDIRTFSCPPLSDSTSSFTAILEAEKGVKAMKIDGEGPEALANLSIHI